MKIAMKKNLPVLNRILEIGYTLALVVVLSVIVGLVLAFPVMWLWNFIFGKIYHINVLQAWALNVLASILFGSRSANDKKK